METSSLPTSTAATKPRRRWFQFSLRTLIIVTLVTCCFLSWLGIKRSQSQEAWKGIAFLEEQGVTLSIRYSAKFEGNWLEQQLGINLPGPVEAADVTTSGDPERILQEVAKLRKLERLYITFAKNFTDKHLALLTGLNHLTLLSLSDASIHGSGLAYLSGNQSLEWLSLDGCSNLTDEGLRSLPHLPCLKHLSLDRSPISGTGFSHLRDGFPKLESMTLFKTPLTDHGLEELGKLHTLKQIDSIAMTEDQLHYLDNLKQLEKIHIKGLKFSDVALYHLGKHPHLTELDLQKAPITDVGMAHLRELRELKLLIVSDTAIGDQGLEAIDGEKLEHLGLNRARITDASAAKMAIFQKLRSIELRETEITDAFLPMIAKLPVLKSIDLTGTQITDECIPLIASLPALEYVQLQETKITDAALIHFQHHKTLKGLSLPKQLKRTPGAIALKSANPELIIIFY